MRNYYFLKPRLSLESSAMNHQVATRGQLCIAFGHHFVGTGVLWKVSEEGELPWWLSGKEPTCNAGDPGSIPGWGRFPGGGNGNPTGVLLPWKSHGQKNLVGYSPWGCKESDTTERVTLSLQSRGVT